VGNVVKKIKILLLVLFVPGLAMAQEYTYVGDHLVITIRAGKGTQYQIIDTAPSGEKLEVLERTDEGYTFIRTEDGVEGWVRTQYLSDEPIARELLAAAQARLDKVLEQNKKLKAELDSLSQSSGSLQKDRQALASENSKMEKEIARLKEIAARPIQLDNENRKLQQANVSLEKQLQLISQENQVLKDRSQREWFITGALVLLGGLILGLIIPRIRWKKRSSW
jgi:SH3 domain protein